MPHNLLPIELSLSVDALQNTKRQGSDGMVSAPSSFDPNADEDTRKKIFERDNHTCQYCGFESKKFQLVHVKDGNPKNTSDDNLATSCIFCHQCFHIDKVADMKSGTLIWMPEMTQAQVHHLARSIYVARITQGPMTEIARNTLEMIMKRREEAIKRLKTDDPKVLSLVLRDYLTNDQYNKRHAKLDGIRLFPLDRRAVTEGDYSFNQFPQILAYWRSKDGPFASMTPNDWVDRYTDLKAA
jgi:intracellular multiplication protein IcmJ